jgi:hypothetical protein
MHNLKAEQTALCIIHHFNCEKNNTEEIMNIFRNGSGPHSSAAWTFFAHCPIFRKYNYLFRNLQKIATKS